MNTTEKSLANLKTELLVHRLFLFCIALYVVLGGMIRYETDRRTVIPKGNFETLVVRNIVFTDRQLREQYQLSEDGSGLTIKPASKSGPFIRISNPEGRMMVEFCDIRESPLLRLGLTLSMPSRQPHPILELVNNGGNATATLGADPIYGKPYFDLRNGPAQAVRFGIDWRTGRPFGGYTLDGQSHDLIK